MKVIKQILIIAKTLVRDRFRYPEAYIGGLFYYSIALFVAYLYSHLGGGFLGNKVIPYYLAGLFMISLMAHETPTYKRFSVWREEILSKPIIPDIFLMGFFVGDLIAFSVPALATLSLLLLPFIYRSGIHNSSLLFLSLTIALFASLSVSYFFAALGLRFRYDPNIETATNLFIAFFAGIFIPVQSLPAKVHIISYIIPYTWAIDLFRYSLLGTPTLFPVKSEIEYLIMSIAVVFILGRFYLHYTINAIRKKKVVIR